MQRTIEQELALRGHGLFQTVGDSMEPLLHNRKSTVVIEIPKNMLKKYDVALYRRPGGEYVLHRVIKVVENAYIICGDNRIHREKVPTDWVIGVMTGYYKDERNNYVSCEDEIYRKYLRTLKWRYWRLLLQALFRRVRRKFRQKSSGR